MPTLSPKAYDFFPLDAISPKGWLLEQLKEQALGLGGKLDRFWPSICDSGWTGGGTDSWERLPYWLDGFIPLAFLLRDEDMMSRARQAVDAIIARQQPDGWLCPCDEDERYRYDMWALFLVLKALVVWHDATGDARVEGVVRSALQLLDRHIDSFVLFAWAQTRWFEALIPLFWLYERTGEPWLLDLAVKLRAQGFDWVALYENWPMQAPYERGRWSQMTHVVNQAMMLKSGALYARLSGLVRDRDAADDMLAKLDQYHGTAWGLFTGDECLAGSSPAQGTELCAVVEAMYSLEWLAALTGEVRYADRLERVAFNALAGAFTPDMEYHQYAQQVNQVQCSFQEEPVYLTNGPETGLFGVEPHFGCCTANFHQGWPKLAASVFMKSPRGIAVVLPLASELNTEVNGVPVRISVEGDYPFSGNVRVTVEAESPVAFELSVRIPGWAEGASLKLDGASVNASADAFACMERVWRHNVVELDLPMPVSLLPRPNGLSAVARGPLLYSLNVPGRWVKQDKEGVGDMPWLNNFEVFPTAAWNYGLCVDALDPAKDIRFEERPVGARPFSPEGAPVRAKLRGRKVPWQMVRGAAAPAPSGEAYGESEELELIPYGCTVLRMTEMPVVPCK